MSRSSRRSLVTALTVAQLALAGGAQASLDRPSHPPGGRQSASVPALTLPRTAVATATAPAASAPGAVPAASDIRGRLNAIPGMRVTGEGGLGDYRYYTLTYRQPVDQRNPTRSWFEQRISLLHREENRPTVLYSTGYGLPLSVSPAEPTALIEGNQVSVEERFFTPSRPEPADWQKLTIWQAATDHHRIVTALKTIYPGRWLSTGASKGGMASVYHRRFYPGDVDGTIAYVAPDDVVDDVDAYPAFLDHVGDDPACRDRLVSVQRQALTHRAELVKLLLAQAKQRGDTYDQVFGSADKALEMLVVEMPFVFWQFHEPNGCATVPAGTATVDQLFAFLDQVADVHAYTDQGNEPVVPYYYQAGTELGYPSFGEQEHLAGLLRYPGQVRPRSYVPASIPMHFDPTVMPDIDGWVRNSGRSLMFVYGQDDPWGAEPFRLGPGTRDSYWYQVPHGNHLADLSGLPAPQRTEATAAIRRWAGLTRPGPGLPPGYRWTDRTVRDPHPRDGSIADLLAAAASPARIMFGLAARVPPVAPGRGGPGTADGIPLHDPHQPAASLA